MREETTMKKKYQQPTVKDVALASDELLGIVSGNETSTTPVHNDDPKAPEEALSRHGSVWEE